MTRIEMALFEIEKYLLPKYGTRMTENYMSPLAWYVNTGRCPLALEKWICSCKPFVIGRVLSKGGSHDEVIRRLWSKSGMRRAA